MNDFDITVLEMVREFGTKAVYTRQATGEYDPATGSVGGADRQLEVRGILMDFTLQSNGLGYKYGTQILAGDKQFFMQPPAKSDVGVPFNVTTANDCIKVGSVTYKIVTVKEVNPTGSDPILYEFLLRR